MVTNGVPALDLRRFRSACRRREGGAAARDAARAGDAAGSARPGLPSLPGPA